MKKSIIIAACLFFVVLCIYAYLSPVEKTESNRTYQNTEIGLSFDYPGKYFTIETLAQGEREIRTITLLEDTEENRSLVNNQLPGRESPPTITLTLYQNNLDKYDAETFINNNSHSNFKLSDGKITNTALGNIPALKYNATGLYENENIVAATPSFVYMATVNFSSPQDTIITDFNNIISTLKITTSPDN